MSEAAIKSVDLPTQYQQFIHRSRYARWRDDLRRRETWPETVERYLQFMVRDRDTLEYLPGVDEKVVDELRKAILNLEVMPSMRALMTAGPALDRNNIAGYNCAYTPIDRPLRFSEAMLILMCGTGAGFSCELEEVSKLPAVPKYRHPWVVKVLRFFKKPAPWVVQDSKEGWQEAYAHLVESLYEGRVPEFDYSIVRPKGARLKTFGGRASGPEPLKELFEFTIKTFKEASGRKLKPIEVHDIVCKIGEVVVVGGVRRSAEISLSDLSDTEMSEAKAGAWWVKNPQRALANNSAVYNERPSVGDFMAEWLSIFKSGSGERGIFSRAACRMLNDRVGRSNDVNHGTNPCSEIILRPQQFCNLTEVVVRPNDNIKSLKRKVRLATILGTFQARLTKFPGLSPEWSETTAREALLGVSMTGVFDGPELSDADLDVLRVHAEAINDEWAAKIGINRAAAITCVKPSGTVSQLVDAASGLHTRHSPYYIRRVRGDLKDPLTQLLLVEGVPAEPCVLKPEQTVVFSFPMKSPEGAPCREDITAIEHLEKWLHYQKHWCDHKPSVTISVKEHEWPEVGAWVWNNFDWMSGVSFLPYDGGTYQQAPYEECTKEQYEELAAKMPVIDWEKLSLFEKEDNTAGSQTLACTGGVCEIVDVGTNE